MTLSRRKTLALIGGGVIFAATASLGAIASRAPRTAGLPWETAGRETEPRRKALSYALLAPNPHNRQPWLVDLAEPGVVTLYVDRAKVLPHTDPTSRQITIGLGCFLELMRMAASHDGQRVTITPFPDGEGVRCRTVPEQEVVVGTLLGGFEGIGTVMEAIDGWAGEHGYRFAGPMFNIYRVGPAQEPDPARWVTEVCAPVELVGALRS